MIRKLNYVKPQSDIVRLPSPMVLTGNSVFSTQSGAWDVELLLSPEVFETEVVLPDNIEAML